MQKQRRQREEGTIWDLTSIMEEQGMLQENLDEARDPCIRLRLVRDVTILKGRSRWVTV
jgi:hypothetical protein